MDFETKKIVAILLNIFIPGLGNLILGQRDFGIKVLIPTIILTPFYFVPFFAFLFDNSQMMVTFFALTCFFAIILFLIDVGLMIISIMKAANYQGE